MLLMYQELSTREFIFTAVPSTAIWFLEDRRNGDDDGSN